MGGGQLFVLYLAYKLLCDPSKTFPQRVSAAAEKLYLALRLHSGTGANSSKIISPPSFSKQASKEQQKIKSITKKMASKAKKTATESEKEPEPEEPEEPGSEEIDEDDASYTEKSKKRGKKRKSKRGRKPKIEKRERTPSPQSCLSLVPSPMQNSKMNSAQPRLESHHDGASEQQTQHPYRPQRAVKQRALLLISQQTEFMLSRDRQERIQNRENRIMDKFRSTEKDNKSKATNKNPVESQEKVESLQTDANMTDLRYVAVFEMEGEEQDRLDEAYVHGKLIQKQTQSEQLSIVKWVVEQFPGLSASFVQSERLKCNIEDPPTPHILFDAVLTVSPTIVRAVIEKIKQHPCCAIMNSIAKSKDASGHYPSDSCCCFICCLRWSPENTQCNAFLIALWSSCLWSRRLDSVCESWKGWDLSWTGVRIGCETVDILKLLVSHLFVTIIKDNPSPRKENIENRSNDAMDDRSHLSDIGIMQKAMNSMLNIMSKDIFYLFCYSLTGIKRSMLESMLFGDLNGNYGNHYSLLFYIKKNK